MKNSTHFRYLFHLVFRNNIFSRRLSYFQVGKMKINGNVCGNQFPKAQDASAKGGMTQFHIVLPLLKILALWK